MSEDTVGVYDERLQIRVVKLEYDFVNHCGRLYQEWMSYCDMGGCLKLFKAIDPNVVAILTFDDGKPDTLYRKEGSKWTAYDVQTVYCTGCSKNKELTEVYGGQLYCSDCIVELSLQLP